MADQNEQPTEPKKKRRLKASAETIRERSERHQQKAAAPDEPRRMTTFLSGFTWPLRQLGRGLRRLNRIKFFRIIGYILLPKYLRNSWRELRLVTWPGRRTTWRLVWAVIAFSVVFGLIVAGVDFVLDKLFKELILQ